MSNSSALIYNTKEKKKKKGRNHSYQNEQKFLALTVSIARNFKLKTRTKQLIAIAKDFHSFLPKKTYTDVMKIGEVQRSMCIY